MCTKCIHATLRSAVLCMSEAMGWQAWAYGNLGYDAGSEFWDALGDAAARCMRFATPQHKANLVGTCLGSDNT